MTDVVSIECVVGVIPGSVGFSTASVVVGVEVVLVYDFVVSVDVVVVVGMHISTEIMIHYIEINFRHCFEFE
jgi:hypothetical protein